MITGTMGVMLAFAAMIAINCVVWRTPRSQWPRKRLLKEIEKLKRRREKINEKLSEFYGGGTCCPRCLRWPWETENPSQWTCSTLPAQMTCGTCGHVSHWVDGPVMIPIPPPLAPVYIG